MGLARQPFAKKVPEALPRGETGDDATVSSVQLRSHVKLPHGRGPRDCQVNPWKKLLPPATWPGPHANRGLGNTAFERLTTSDDVVVGVQQSPQLLMINYHALRHKYSVLPNAPDVVTQREIGWR